MPTLHATLGGRYELTERIASGGMGEVWRARDLTLNRVVAVKLLREAYVRDETFLERFRAEARHNALLSHPGIADVYDYGESPDDPSGALAYLVMECVDGKPLSAIIREQGPLEPALVSSLVSQVALALDAAHEAGVVHRDIKPANLLVTADGTVKLTDFGIARSGDGAALTGTGMVMGTAQYLAPEQCSGAKAEPASDVYALGILAYECLTGHRPFDGTNPVAVAVAQINDDPAPLPLDVPEPLRGLVMRCLAKDPGDRPAPARTIAEALSTPATAVLPTVTPHQLDEAETTVLRAPAGPPWWTASSTIAATWLVGVLLVIAAVLAGHGGSSPAAVAAPPKASASPAKHSSSPTTVQVSAATYVGKPASTVTASLERLGLHVRRSSVISGAPTGSVVSVSPTGRLRKGTTVTISVATAAPRPAPAPVKHRGKHKHGHDD